MCRPELADEQAGEVVAVGLEDEAGMAECGVVVGQSAKSESGEETEGTVK